MSLKFKVVVKNPAEYENRSTAGNAKQALGREQVWKGETSRWADCEQRRGSDDDGDDDGDNSNSKN